MLSVTGWRLINHIRNLLIVPYVFSAYYFSCVGFWSTFKTYCYHLKIAISNMDQDSIKRQLRHWMTRKVPKGFARVVDDLPISIASDVGLLRAENQDKAVLLRAQVTPLKSFVVGVLCDGMGGMVDGAECASLAVSSFISSCIRNRALDVNTRLLKAVNEANRDVFLEYQGNGGSTLSAFIFDSDGNASAVNVGDSRIYTVSSNKIKQLSVDDTIAGQLNYKGDDSPMSHKLLQFVGIGSDLEIHQVELPEISSISKLLLTSDGVHYLPEFTFNSLILQDISPFELSKRLINVAKWCGGHDNATTIVISEPSTIFSNSSPAVTGTVQLWDFNGDVYFIGIEKPQSADDGNVDPKLSDSVKKETPKSDEVSAKEVGVVKEFVSTKEEVPIKKEVSIKEAGNNLNKDVLNRENSKKKDTQVRKKGRKPASKSNVSKGIPQLRIDFDE